MAFASRVPGMQYRPEPTISSLSEVLQSDPVRRLFNQPNIVIKTLPTKNKNWGPGSKRKNGVGDNYHIPRQPDLSIHVIDNASDSKEEETFLPSKNNGKSDIALIPISNEKKKCGHCEPCESLVCDVIVQHYEDHEGISPIVSVNIDEDEINAPVGKHCKNSRCDTLSIDHDRCRRASVKLYHCDKNPNFCDICGILFNSCNDRVTHKKCKRKDEYRHNEADREQILRVRMREREIQIIESAKYRKNCNYLDPVYGPSRALEAVKRNEEILVIAKPRITTQSPIITITTLPNATAKTIQQNNQRIPTGNREFNEMLPNLQNNTSTMHNIPITNMPVANMPIMFTPQQNITIQQNPTAFNQLNVNSPTPPKQIRLESVNGTVVNPAVFQSQAPIFNTIGSNTLQPSLAALNNWLISQGNSSTITQQQFMMGNTPFRVVPIANLKSQPSLLHQAQGVPRFCIVADKSVSPKQAAMIPKTLLQPHINPSVSVKVTPTLLPQVVPRVQSEVTPPVAPVLLQCSENKESKKDEVSTNVVMKVMPKLIPKYEIKMTHDKKPIKKFRPLKPLRSCTIMPHVNKQYKPKLKKKRPRSRKSAGIRKRSKLFNCTYCEKRFCSLSYCKMHIAEHEGEVWYYCKICEKPYTKKSLMQKHLAAEHKEGQVRCEMCGYIADSLKELDYHQNNREDRKIKCSECANKMFNACNDLNKHLCEEHGFIVCPQCKHQIAKIKFLKHFMVQHSISKVTSEKTYARLCNTIESDSVNEIITDNGNTDNNESDVKFTDKDNESVVKETNGLSPKTEIKLNKLHKSPIATRTRSPRLRPNNTSNIYKCSVCSKVFENEIQLQIHISNNPSRIVVCGDCGNTFHRKKDLSEHASECKGQSVNQAGVLEETRTKLNKSDMSIDGNVLPSPVSSMENSIQPSEKTMISSNSVQFNDTENENTELPLGCERVKASTEDINEIKEEESVNEVTKDPDLTMNCDMTETVAETVVNTHVKQLEEKSDVNLEL